MTLPRLVITPGEPAGIGPDTCLQLAQQNIPAAVVFVTDPEVLQTRARQLELSPDINTVTTIDDLKCHQADILQVLPVICPEPVKAGTLNIVNASFVTRALNLATDLVYSGKADAIVTAPIHKGVINDAGISFSGHTEWLAARTNTRKSVMMLVNQNFRVAFATTHLPLQDISNAITSELLEEVITILRDDLRTRFHIRQPHIRICGLNPHAGEAGHLGREEVDTIIPVVQQLRKRGFSLQGPVSADTAFLPDTLGDVDVILAMYHDQGLPVLKYSNFDTAVNITLGLPVIRTSVDHGTALDLAGTGKASASSLRAAVDMAIQMVKGKYA